MGTFCMKFSPQNNAITTTMRREKNDKVQREHQHKHIGTKKFRNEMKKNLGTNKSNLI